MSHNFFFQKRKGQQYKKYTGLGFNYCKTIILVLFWNAHNKRKWACIAFLVCMMPIGKHANCCQNIRSCWYSKGHTIEKPLKFAQTENKLSKFSYNVNQNSKSTQKTVKIFLGIKQLKNGHITRILLELSALDQCLRFNKFRTKQINRKSESCKISVFLWPALRTLVAFLI